jgi:hypothetical protein
MDMANINNNANNNVDNNINNNINNNVDNNINNNINNNTNNIYNYVHNVGRYYGHYYIHDEHYGLNDSPIIIINANTNTNGIRNDVPMIIINANTNTNGIRNDVPMTIISDNIEEKINKFMSKNIMEISIDMNQDDDCVICCEQLKKEKAGKFHCGHIMHISCIKKYIKSKIELGDNITCPICRHLFL